MFPVHMEYLHDLLCLPEHSIYLPDHTARNTVSHNAMPFPLTNELETSATIFIIAVMIHYLMELTGFDPQFLDARMFKMWVTE